jgi:hypothetical protein
VVSIITVNVIWFVGCQWFSVPGLTDEQQEGSDKRGEDFSCGAANLREIKEEDLACPHNVLQVEGALTLRQHEGTWSSHQELTELVVRWPEVIGCAFLEIVTPKVPSYFVIDPSYYEFAKLLALAGAFS